MTPHTPCDTPAALSVDALADAFTWLHIRLTGGCSESHRREAGEYVKEVAARAATPAAPEALREAAAEYLFAAELWMRGVPFTADESHKSRDLWERVKETDAALRAALAAPAAPSLLAGPGSREAWLARLDEVPAATFTPPEGECGFDEPHDPHTYVIAGPDNKPLDQECPGLAATPAAPDPATNVMPGRGNTTKVGSVHPLPEHGRDFWEREYERGTATPAAPTAAEKAALGVCPVCDALFKQEGHSFDCPLSVSSGAATPAAPEALREALFDEYGVNVVAEALAVAIDAPAEMEVNRERWRAARDALAAALAATPDPVAAEGLDVERLARAFDLNGVNWPKRWGDNDFAWLARQVAAEYARLAKEAEG